VLSAEAAFERKQVIGGRGRSYVRVHISRAVASRQTRKQRAQVMLNEARRAIDFCAANGDLTKIFRAKVKEAFAQAAAESVGDDATDDLGIEPVTWRGHGLVDAVRLTYRLGASASGRHRDVCT